MPLDGLHTQRDRAESFGSTAEDYDRYRPGYPPALINDLVAAGPANALDVGCGTGKVAVALMQRGLSVLGIDPDDRMAAVARRKGVPVEVESFESWEPAGRTYDLMTAGHSWHWVEPQGALAKAASVLVPGGTIALFWNYHVVEEPLLSLFDAAYRAHAPELSVVGHDPSGAEDTDPFQDCDDVISLGSRTYRWPRPLSAEEWAAMLATFSDHAALEVSRLGRLQAALREAIAQSGGRVRSQCGTYVWKAQRVGAPALRT